MSMAWLPVKYSCGLGLLSVYFILIFMAPLRLSSLNINGVVMLRKGLVFLIIL